MKRPVTPHLADRCAEHPVEMHYIQPGKPDQNAYIEPFNRTYRTEVLSAHLFESIAELRALTTEWLRIYNSGPTTASAGRRRSRFCRGLHPPASLLSNCPLDGKAYGRVAAIVQCDLASATRMNERLTRCRESRSPEGLNIELTGWLAAVGDFRNWLIREAA